MEENYNREEKSYLENFWKSQRIEMVGSVKREIENLILLSRNKKTLESKQIRNAESQGINLMIPFSDSGQIKKWVDEFLIHFDNLTKKEFRHWLIEERTRIIGKAKKANKLSFYFDILKTIKTLLSEEEVNNQDQNLKNRLIKLFANGEIENCFSLFQKNDISTKELLLLQNRWATLNRLKATGQIEISSSPEENRIKGSLLSFIQKIEN